jgi:hypothetical protein
MNDLIEALTLFAKYTTAAHPTHCEHDELYVLVDPERVSREDRTRLKALGFEVGPGNFRSLRFGAA